MKGSWMRSLVLFLPVAVAGLSLSACNSSTPASATTITGIAVSGSTPAIGSTSQFTATVTFSNNTTQDVTSTATWVSYNTAVATVSSTGVVTAVAVGTSVLEATYQSVAGTFGLTVTTGENISSVDLSTGKIPTIGSPAQFTCTATFSDGTTQDCTGTATWVSFSPAIATVSSAGLVTAHATGTAVVKATYQGSSGTYTFTVTH
jgi:hypothetical protein